MSAFARYAATSWGLLAVATLWMGCSGKPAARSADDASEDEATSAVASESSSNADAEKRPPSDEGPTEGEDETAPKKAPSDEPPEPAFTETMSVDEAIKAVPAGFERRNIDQETLGKPLQEASVYEPCKVGSARVKLRVAVWQGKAVGVDVSTTPKNEKLAECIKGRIRELKWDAKVKSLNTIEYQL